MASDAHAHPKDLEEKHPGAESERLELRIPCAASSWNLEEFLRHEELSAACGAVAACGAAAPLVLCFGVHPQVPAGLGQDAARRSLEELHRLAGEGRLRALGESGFDLFDAAYRATEPLQEELFVLQAELALEKGLPLVLHLRRAMHKAFAYSRTLSRLKAVVVHSYPGTLREAQDLLKRGVNAYFSFGTTILLNHKQAMASCAGLSADRLLFETDAPYQPLRNRSYSTYADLRSIIEQAARLKLQAGDRALEGMGEAEAAQALERAADRNFERVFLEG